MNVRSAGKHLFRRLGIRQGFKPDWHVGRFLASLSSRCAPFREFQRKQSPRPTLQTAGRFFRERSEPRFFVDPPEIPKLVSRLEREHREWKERTILRVRQDCREGLSIYTERGPALDGEFPWGRLSRGRGGDKLYRKRPHRFAFAPRLALASWYGEPSDKTLHDVVLGWMKFASGRANELAYDSNLAVIQRILALSWAWSFLAARASPGDDGLTLEGLLIQVLHQDVQFLAPRLGEAHANNHLLADGFAGWFLGLFWPELSPNDLKQRFEPLWLRELERQTLADGTSFEHSTHYHEYACEMAAAYALLSRRNDLLAPAWLLERTRRLLQFQLAVAESGPNAIAIGDAAEDPLFPLDSGDGWGTGAWPDVLRSLFSAGIPASPCSASRERAFWLLRGDLSHRTNGDVAPSGIERYPNGGYYFCRDRAAEAALLFRTGPDSRELSSPGHMHADLMSVCLAARGHALIADAGTFTYRRASERWPPGEPDWRGYFSGPAAHNALAIDGQDPLGAFDGDFRKRLLCSVSTKKDLSDSFTSWVDAVLESEGAYGGYRRGIVHIQGEYWVVYDCLPGSTAGEARSLGFQFGHECRIERMEARDVEVRCGEVALFLNASTGLNPAVSLSGSRDPLGGWISRVYGDLTPSPQVRFPVDGSQRYAAFLMRLGPQGGKLEKGAVEVERLDSDGLRLDVAIGHVEDTLLLNLGAHNAELHSRGLRFRGELARLRRRAGRLELVHWLNGLSLAAEDMGLFVEDTRISRWLRLESGHVHPGSASPETVRWPD